MSYINTDILTINGNYFDTIKIGSNLPLVLIAGPCAIETKDHTFYMAENIKKICDDLKIQFIYKSCYDKDCRSSPKSFHGVGID